MKEKWKLREPALFERNIGWKEESGMVEGISNMHITAKENMYLFGLKVGFIQ